MQIHLVSEVSAFRSARVEDLGEKAAMVETAINQTPEITHHAQVDNYVTLLLGQWNYGLTLNKLQQKLFHLN